MVYVLNDLFELAVEMIFGIFWWKICLVEFEIKLWKLMKIDCTPCWFSLLWCELLRFWIKSEKYLEHNISKMFCQIFSIFNVSKSMLCSSAVKRNWRNYEIHVLRKCSLKFIEKQKMNKKRNFLTHFVVSGWISAWWGTHLSIPFDCLSHASNKKHIYWRFSNLFHRFIFVQIIHLEKHVIESFVHTMGSSPQAHQRNMQLIDVYE